MGFFGYALALLRHACVFKPVSSNNEISLANTTIEKTKKYISKHFNPLKIL